MPRVSVKPEMLRWARQRARLDAAVLTTRFPKLVEWEREERQPTLKQLENYAHATMTPVGFFFLPQPPEERLPIPDFRTLGDQALGHPSPNLLDTIYLCQQRQSWYRDHALAHGLPVADFVGSANLQTPVEEAAAAIRQRLGFNLDDRRDCRTWEDALRQFIAQADTAGVMAMCSGVVLNNNHRKLDPDEFRGFAMADPLAPLVFINGADSKAAQMFTLAHELAHLWLGQTALSNAEAVAESGEDVERWCNRVAAELLVPAELMRAEIHAGEPLEDAKRRLARRFKVSTLVILRRMADVGALSRQEFWEAYRMEVVRLEEIRRAGGGGGNFYLSQAARVSKRFARALFESTLEGRTLYRDAMKMLGISKVGTFNELGRSLSFPI
ncbi:MAG: ImmA/IrrE family metallo-endopeptidase [Rhodocyclales bacterium]|nr:ImmA/IrrE family metallo-endopeptidase [Rhodocyclales bacterium]